MKYFFLSEGWTIGRVWEFGGLWNEIAWRRKPDIQQLTLGIVDNGDRLWLYSVEDAVIMVEVTPTASAQIPPHSTIGQVVLKRLIDADQVLDRLMNSEQVFAQTARSPDESPNVSS
ncbi:hypothetical protein [Geitlerinema sp. PCC 7407]|uniref:hypothetical protein n=1 Tax=Geitlerinema sp. PCC 7407 TaxID=1173025 RepID=UPI00029F8AA0|nr:hypothetical protein [Geitlerinema sp. PCC 7407]AFY67472.1 hypothetical protein GEI7407_3002 [Geitlerinema sp. PCC 7407]